MRTHLFQDVGTIRYIVAIDDTHYLLAAWKGLLKTTKDQLIKHSYKEKKVRSLCHITDSVYLVGSFDDGLIAWNEETD